VESTKSFADWIITLKPQTLSELERPETPTRTAQAKTPLKNNFKDRTGGAVKGWTKLFRTVSSLVGEFCLHPNTNDNMEAFSRTRVVIRCDGLSIWLRIAALSLLVIRPGLMRFVQQQLRHLLFV
jgi:hypothetical protein